MAEGYRVQPDELRAHASTLRGFQDRASTAVDAGSHVASLDEAYGILCQAFGSMTQEPQNRGVEALRRAERATGRLADDMGSAVEAYERMEDRVTRILRELSRSLENVNATGEKGAC